MNRDEIADKLINIARKEGYRYANMNTWYLFADFVLSEIAAAEKRARREVAQSILDDLESNYDDDGFVVTNISNDCREIIAANSDHPADAGEMIGGK